MKFFRDRNYLLSRITAVLVASVGGTLAFASLAFYVVGVNFSGPIYGALIKSSAPRLGAAFCVGLLLLLLGLLARAVFHLAAAERSRQSGV